MQPATWMKRRPELKTVNK